jgi:hypothetical protein
LTSHSPTLTGSPVWKRILRCIGALLALALHSLGVRYRRVFHRRKYDLLDLPRLLYATPVSLLRECATDLRTALLRMECRFDALPNSWTYDVGPCFERDSKGNLRPNRDSDARMRGIERFQTERPTATLFDSELFLAGWAAGVQYAQRTLCTEDTAGNTCTPPDQNSISDSVGKVPPPSWQEPPALAPFIVERLRKFRLGLNRGAVSDE